MSGQLLLQEGFKHVSNLFGGMTKWSERWKSNWI